MKTRTLLIFSFIPLTVALALIPFAAAQDSNMLSDGLSSIWTGISNFGGQAQEYITSHVPETAAIGTATGSAGILGYAYRGASKAKNMLAGQISGIQSQAETALSTVTSEKEKLTQQLTEQTSSLQTQIQTQINQATAKIKTESEASNMKLLNLNTNLEQQLKDQKSLYHDLEIRYKELQSHMP